MLDAPCASRERLAAALCFITSASRSTTSGLPLAAKPTVAGGYLVVNDDFSA
jgi:hypothetical protein